MQARSPATTRSCATRSRPTAAYVVKTTGDGFHAAFADRARRGRRRGRRRSSRSPREPWGATGPLRVRMGVHTGEARAARRRLLRHRGESGRRLIMSVAHGGQIVVLAGHSELVRDALGDVELVDLGEHGCRDLARPERSSRSRTRSCAREFPPLAIVGCAIPANLPLQVDARSSGRDDEVADVIERTRRVTARDAHRCRRRRQDPPRAPGRGRGAAARFADGAWLCELGPLCDPDAVSRRRGRRPRRAAAPGHSLAEQHRRLRSGPSSCSSCSTTASTSSTPSATGRDDRAGLPERPRPRDQP